MRSLSRLQPFFDRFFLLFAQLSIISLKNLVSVFSFLRFCLIFTFPIVYVKSVKRIWRQLLIRLNRLKRQIFIESEISLPIDIDILQVSTFDITKFLLSVFFHVNLEIALEETLHVLINKRLIHTIYCTSWKNYYYTREIYSTLS